MQQFSSKALVLLAILAFIKAAAANTARTCYHCEGINCQRTSLSKTQQCVDSLDYCVTIFEKFNVVRRGCSSEVPSELRRRCDRNTVECHKCYSDHCNNWGQVEFQCLQCDSSKDANCAKNPTQIMATRCGIPTAPNSYCYIKQENGATKRGCATAVVEQEKCLKDTNCLLCSPADIRNCNNVDMATARKSRWFYKL